MRTVLFALLTLVASAVAADPKADVFAHECRAINPKQTGFECSVNKAGKMRIYWQENLRKLPPDHRQKAEYESNRLLVRYFDLGGTHFFVRNQGEDRMRSCARTSGRGYSTNCMDCDLKGENCKEIH